ncbi:MAG: TIM-barrel domain-containing protein [Myxococcota bacterium]
MKKLLTFFFFLILYSCDERWRNVDTNSPLDSSTTDTGIDSELAPGLYTIELHNDLFNIRSGALFLEGKGISEEVPSMLAARDVEIAYEMMYGSFKPVDRNKTKWVGADRLEYERLSEESISVVMYREKEKLGRLIFQSKRSDEGGFLQIDFYQIGRYNRFSIAFRCMPDEHFIGFGAQSIDVDHYGNTLFGWVQEQGIGKIMSDSYDDPLWYLSGRKHSSQIPIPQILSSRNYVLTVMDNIRPVMYLCSEDPETLRLEFDAGTTIYLFAGKSPKEALKIATSVTGRSRLPPDFAFFPWIDAIFGSENVRRIAQRLRDEDIPSSVIWTEDYKGAEFKGDRYVLSERWNIDRTLYPDFERLSDDLHNLGFKFLVYFNSFVYLDSDVYSDLNERGYLIRDRNNKTYLFDGAKGSKSSLLDLLNEDAVNWLKDKMNDIIKKGADGWMGDFAEWLPADSILYDSKNKKDVSGLLVHNQYPVIWQRIQREVIDSQKDGKDRLFFVRSGWFGTPALADVIWAGDQRTSFDEDDGMPTIIPIGIGLGICGISNFGHDIAGYQSATNPPSDKELFFRWTEIGAFSPIMRTHHGYMPKLNWSWESDEETISFFRRYAKIHSSLFPYLKGLALEASEIGIPAIRSIAVEYPSDQNVWTIKDQYLLGEKILVAPVMKRGNRVRRVYLPQGRWATFEQNGFYIEGGRYITINSPLDYIPVFVKEGGIIPLIKEEIKTNVDIDNIYRSQSWNLRYRIIKLFLGKDGYFRESDRLSYRLRMIQEYSERKELHFKVDGREINICGESRQNCYKKDEADRYILYVGSCAEVEIYMEDKKIALFQIDSKEDFESEIRVFY